MTMRLLLFAIVAAGNALTLNRIQSVAKLLRCGDFEHGFLVAQCQRCGDSLRVPFACKSRGICPSCMGRRMAETAALLVADE